MRVLANSVQKSGTHLLLRLLEQLGVPRFPRWRLDPEWTLERSLAKRLRMSPPGVGQPVGIGRGVTVSSWWLDRLFAEMPPSSALLAHCGHTTAIAERLLVNRVRTLCIVRDPRDVAVSHAHFLMKIGKDKITRKPEHRALVELPDHGARMLALLRGHPGTPSIAERFNEFLGWKDHDDVHVVRFEDLVGAAGGGDDSTQRTTIARVSQYLDLERSAEQIEEIRAALFGGTATFRKGTTEQWRAEFGPEHRRVARRTLGPTLSAFGYALDDD